MYKLRRTFQLKSEWILITCLCNSSNVGYMKFDCICSWNTLCINFIWVWHSVNIHFVLTKTCLTFNTFINFIVNNTCIMRACLESSACHWSWITLIKEKNKFKILIQYLEQIFPNHCNSLGIWFGSRKFTKSWEISFNKLNTFQKPLFMPFTVVHSEKCIILYRATNAPWTFPMDPFHTKIINKFQCFYDNCDTWTWWSIIVPCYNNHKQN